MSLLVLLFRYITVFRVKTLQSKCCPSAILRNRYTRKSRGGRRSSESLCRKRK